MSTYLFHGFQTPETLAKLLAAPEDRAAVIAPLYKSLGGELLGYWYGIGGAEVYVIFELPDDVTATGFGGAGRLVRRVRVIHLYSADDPAGDARGARRSGRHGLPRAGAA
jgi:hypothetical protein